MDDDEGMADDSREDADGPGYGSVCTRLAGELSKEPLGSSCQVYEEMTESIEGTGHYTRFSKPSIFANRFSRSSTYPFVG
jgi:hypothetical protein